jgi:cation diffusion facilitator CzcD-associated flavoprotein CzcO
VYQYTFEPNTQWSKFFSPGPEILEYVRGVARKYQVEEKVQFNTTITKTEWDEERGIWSVEAESTRSDGEVLRKTTETEVVISAVGLLNNWKYPDIEGLLDFKRKLLHSATWDLEW